MVQKWVNQAKETTGVNRAVRGFLWWGIGIRGLLLFALVTLLVVEGNFLAEWLLSWRILPSKADVEEYTIASYITLFTILVIGGYARWRVIRRINKETATVEND